jgi:hypothetical protein
MIGDHIRALVGGEWRHAIDCGDGTVLHLASDDAAAPVRVRRSYRPEFVGGAQAVEVVVHRERVFPARQVVARAYSRAADPALARMFASSAAFASWCKAGHVEERESVAVSVPTLVQVAPPGATAEASAAGPVARRPPRKAAPKKGAKPGAKPAQAAGTRKGARKPAAKKAAPRRKAAPRKPGARAGRKPAGRAARRPAAKAPAKARTAARRKGGKARGARR